MAERRMFTKKITDDERFTNLSSSAQALYLHLSMSADDDGFCNQISVSMFKAHASVQDLEALLQLRYIYQFENGVIVIKHWRMANALRKDRYTPTVFQEELSKLRLKDNGSYTLATDGCQTVAKRLPQDRLGKDRLDNLLPPLPPCETKKEQIEIPFVGELRLAFEDWLAYKSEKHQPYKPQGLKSLVSQVKRYADQYGDAAVADVIRDSMASNYQGIILDSLKNRKREKKKFQQSQPMSNNDFSKFIEIISSD